MFRLRLTFVLIGLAAAFLFLSARFDGPIRYASTDHIAYRHPTRDVVLSGAAAISLAVATVLFASVRMGRYRWLAVVPGVMAAVLALVAVDTARSHVTFSSTAVTLPAAGFFREHPTLVYAELAGVTLGQKELLFYFKDGRSLAIPRGDLVRAASKDLIAALEGHNIPCVSF
jgi:hypothetical protein